MSVNLDWSSPDPHDRSYYDAIIEDAQKRVSLLYASWGDANFLLTDVEAGYIPKESVITADYLHTLTEKIFAFGKYFADPAILGAASISGPTWPASGYISGTEMLNCVNLSRNRLLQRYPALVKLPAGGTLFSAARPLLAAWLAAAHSALSLMTIPMVCKCRIKSASRDSVNSDYKTSVADAVADLNSQYQSVPLNSYMGALSYGNVDYQYIDVRAVEGYDDNDNEITEYRAHAHSRHYLIPELLTFKDLAPTPYLILSVADWGNSDSSGFWSAFSGITAVGTYKITLSAPYDLCTTIAASLPDPEVGDRIYYGSRYCLMIFLDYTNVL